jgi:hypothetical protein
MSTLEISILVFGIGALIVYLFYEYWGFKKTIEDFIF